MSRWIAGPALLLFAILPDMAAAQTRTVVVPPGSAVVIAPRGQPAPRPTLGAPTRQQARRVGPPGPQTDDLAAPSAMAVMALAGAAGLAAALAGGGGSSAAAPAAAVRTR